MVKMLLIVRTELSFNKVLQMSRLFRQDQDHFVMSSWHLETKAAKV